MPLVQFVILVLAGLFILPLLLRLLNIAIPIIRKNLGQETITLLSNYAESVFRRASALLTDRGKLSNQETVSQTVGSLFLVAIGIIFTVCDLQYTFATLGPMFGLQVNLTDGFFGRYDQLLGFSLVMLAVVFGIAITDLLNWTKITRFARIKHARPGAFVIALLCFIGTIGVGTALAAYRIPALMVNHLSIPENTFWIQNMPPVILLGLSVLLLIGIAFTMMAFETFFNTLVSLMLVIIGLVFGTISILLWSIDITAAILLSIVDMLLNKTASSSEKAKEITHSIQKSVTKCGRATSSRLNNLVRLESKNLENKEKLPLSDNVQTIGVSAGPQIKRDPNLE